jgi:hypothetical protein
MISWVKKAKKEIISWVVVYAVWRGNKELLNKSLYDHEKRKKNINKYPFCVYSKKRNGVRKKYYTQGEANEILFALLVDKKCAWVSERKR